jgi:hypothetical protein
VITLAFVGVATAVKECSEAIDRFTTAAAAEDEHDGP